VADILWVRSAATGEVNGPLGAACPAVRLLPWARAWTPTPSPPRAWRVHIVVGYENLWHLLPAFAGLAVFVLAQALCYPYLAVPDPTLLDEWRERARRRDAASHLTASDQVQK
jgi:hypothetical protein